MTTSLTANAIDGQASPSPIPTQLWLVPFEPPRWLSGGHAQTLAGNYWRRKPFDVPFESDAVEVDPKDGSRVLCHCHWQPEPVRSRRLTILLLHGLEGSSNSQYIRGISALAWNAGCNVIRMNMRNCGGTETWTPTLYHSGFSSDVAAVLHHFVKLYDLQRVAMVGYSMGGNLVLKLAGELAQQTPKWLLAAVGVSPAVDLAASADALHEPSNRLYERHFLRNLMKRFQRKMVLFPQIYSHGPTGKIATIREFDDRITARYSGFSGADDYYDCSAAARVVSDIAIPTLVLHSLDDPFIRITPVSRQVLASNPAVTFIETQHGGHCAFLRAAASAAEPDLFFAPANCRHWAEATLIRYLMATAGHADGS